MTEQELRSAHKHCANNRNEISKSRFCGCFYCLGRFEAQFVDSWLSEGEGTANCPICRIDSVIGDATGLPVEDRAFLSAMHAFWFDRTMSWDQLKAVAK